MSADRTRIARLASLFLVASGMAGCETDPTHPIAIEQPARPVALDLLAPGATWHGYPGGLADNGTPTVTPVNGRIVIVAISMSNGFMEMNRFIERYADHPEVASRIGLVNCAKGGHALERWLSMASLWDECRQKIQAAGFTPAQVRVVWAKNANQFTDHGRTLPDPNADFHDLVANIAALSQRIGAEFPAVQAVFHSSRIFGGYSGRADRGEPMSYEGGLAINEVIRMQQRGQLPGAPWIGWGPYLWADGAVPNGGGIAWLESDFQSDRVHPSTAGQTKVADALHRFFMQFDWYRRN